MSYLKTEPEILPAPEQIQVDSSSFPPDPSFGEHSPTVSVDIELGKKYSDVSFDYKAFDQETERLGLRPEESSQLSIQIQRSPFYTARGGYLPSEKRIRVVAGSEKRTNNYLRHELKHAADDKEGLLNNNLRYKMGQISLLYSNVFGLGYGLGKLVELTGKHPFLVNDPSYGYAFTGMFATALWGYLLHPMERRARKSARQSNISIISLEKRPMLQRVIGDTTVEPVGATGTFIIGSKKTDPGLITS